MNAILKIIQEELIIQTVLKLKVELIERQEKNGNVIVLDVELALKHGGLKVQNARVKHQNFVPMEYIDCNRMTKFLKKEIRKYDFSCYLFSGNEDYCTLNIDGNPNSKANLVTDAFTFLENLKPNTVDCFIADPIFTMFESIDGDQYQVVKDGFLNANKHHWEKAMRDTNVDERIIKLAMASSLFGHNMAWQGMMYEKLKPGGVVITKRNIANCNTMSQIPQLFYVHDSRPFAHILRFDYKEDLD